MRKIKLLGAAAVLSAAIATPAFAQYGGALGPGSRYGLTPEPDSTYYNGYYYPDHGIWPFNAAVGAVNGAAHAAGAIATAPFRAWNGNGSYAMMRDENYCEQRYRSYDPQSGTYLGYDGRRHPCP